MEKMISIKDMLLILKKRWKVIMLIPLIAGLISAYISFFVLTPVYQATTQILVNPNNAENQFDLSQLSRNVALIETYSDIIKSPVILEKVITDLNLNENVEQLNKKIVINSQGNSQVFSLTVQNYDLKKAGDIANYISETFQKEIQGIMNVNNVSILTKAEFNKNTPPISPNRILNIAITVIIGLALGIGIAFLLEYLDNTLKDSNSIEYYLDIPVLGVVQKIPIKKVVKISQPNKTGVEFLDS